MTLRLATVGVVLAGLLGDWVQAADAGVAPLPAEGGLGGGGAFDARLAPCVSRIHQLEHPISPFGGSVEAQRPSLNRLEAIRYLIPPRSRTKPAMQRLIQAFPGGSGWLVCSRRANSRKSGSTS